MAEVTLFDLDGVLTKGDTMAFLVSRRLLRRPQVLLQAIPLFLTALVLSPQSHLKNSLNRKLVSLALAGLTDEQYALLAVETGRGLASRPGFINAEMVRRCQAAARRGRAIVVTASERRLARAFLDAVKLPDIELVASELGVSAQALTMEIHNVGTVKEERLRQLGVNVGSSTFYTDSATDIPLAAAVRKTVIVNAGARSRRRLLATASNPETLRCR